MKAIPISCLAICAVVWTVAPTPASAQVWVDTNQLGGKLPDWVDPHYYHADQPTPHADRPPRYVWIEPIYRTVCRRVWREPVVEIVHERVWIDARQERREVVYYDACGCRRVRYETVWTPGHYEDRSREVVRSPGCWEMVEVREMVSPGRWETLAMRD